MVKKKKKTVTLERWYKSVLFSAFNERTKRFTPSRLSRRYEAANDRN